MISVAEAKAKILAELPLMPAESLALDRADGRVLAHDVAARVTQPPRALSAMDGYAVRGSDVTNAPVELRQIGEAPAGHAFDGEIGPGETVRIFTGAPLPTGADTIVIQEDTDLSKRDGAIMVLVKQAAATGNYVRPQGLDFSTGQVMLQQGGILGARHIGLAAAMNVPWLDVRRRPRIALLSTGDELVRPGEAIADSQIVSSNSLSLAALIRASGGEAIDLGIALDDEASLRALAAGARGCDMVVTLGGASVGDHDLIRSVLGEDGLELNFWKVAMRPGKPLIFGALHGVPLLGMPGNPVSSLVCGLLFLRPAIHKMLGHPAQANGLRQARLGRDLAANDQREDYLRGALTRAGDGQWLATAFDVQDSSMLSVLAASQCLIMRPPHAGPAKAGDLVQVIPLDEGF